VEVKIVKEKTLYRGIIRGWLIGADGKLKDYFEFENLVVDTGLEYLADRELPTPAMDVMSHYAIGSGSTAPVAGNTTLETELARATLDSVTRDGKKTVYTAAFLPGVGTGTIREAGPFNAAAAGTMLARSVYTTPVTKGASDTYITTHEIEKIAV